MLQCLFRTPLNNYDAVVLLHQDKLSHPQRLLFPTDMRQGWLSLFIYLFVYVVWAAHETVESLLLQLSTGKHVIEGRSSAAFQPYLLLKEIQSLEAARNSLMVGFDPTRCFVEDLKVLLLIPNKRILFTEFISFSLSGKERLVLNRIFKFDRRKSSQTHSRCGMILLGVVLWASHGKNKLQR